MATNSSNITLDAEVGWQAAPHIRGTADIIWNCVSVILLITWTSFHSSVGKSKTKRIFTTFTAVLVPELSAQVALRDLWWVYRLWLSLTEYVERPGWSEGWTLRKSFLVVKGGIIAGRGHTDCSNDPRPGRTTEIAEGEIIDAETFLRLAVMGSIRFEDFPTTDHINDKSKADWVSQVATLIQLIWFIVNISCRISKQPWECIISVMEIITLDWVLFGVPAIIFWWQCPQNINMPYTIPVHNPSMTAPTPNHDPNIPMGTLLDYIAAYKGDPYYERRWGQESGHHNNCLFSPVGGIAMLTPLIFQIPMKAVLCIGYQWHLVQHRILWTVFFVVTTAAELVLFFVEPHMRVEWNPDIIYINYLRPLMLEHPQHRASERKRVGKWITLAKGMGIYSSTNPKPWRHGREKSWHEIELKLLVIAVFVVMVCQAGSLAIAIMAFASAPKAIYSVPDIRLLEVLVHVGG